MNINENASYIIIKDLSVSFEDLLVLDKINLEVKKEEIIALIGPSGCGKSTLLNTISGIYLPDSNGIHIDGQLILDGENKLGRRGRFGYMFQEDRLLPWRTLLNNLTIVDEINGSDIIRTDEAKQHLTKMGLSGFENFYPKQLSGGMKKRAALARTFFMPNDILFLDEPLASVDYSLKLELERYIYKEIINLKKTAIIVTHEYDTAAALADRIIILSNLPAKVSGEFEAGLARSYNDPLIARKSEEFFRLTTNLIEFAGIGKNENIYE